MFLRKYQKSAVSSTTSSGVGSGRPPQVMSFFAAPAVPFLAGAGAALEATAGEDFLEVGAIFFGTKKSLMLKSLTAV